MSAVTGSDRVTFEQLQWAIGCLALALLPQLAALPIWVSVIIGLAAAIRLALAARGRDAPPRAIRLVVSGLAIGLLFLQLHTFTGLAAGSALLCLIAGLKLLETRAWRDIHVIAMIIFFLSLASLLQGESFWLLTYLAGVCWLTTATLLHLTNSRPETVSGSVRYTGRLLAQAVPLAIAFWLFFPRLGGPLWQMSIDDGGATSGLSDTMSPGDITALALSDEVAFRVRFEGAAPPPAEFYWRGPVLHDFDGREWRRRDMDMSRATHRQYKGTAYHYKLSLEPHRHNWIFTLDWPARWDAAAVLTADYVLLQSTPVSQPIDVAATSYTEAPPASELSATLRQRDSWQPPDRNPRMLALAHALRDVHPDDLGYLHAVLDLFHDQPFWYTLTPPRLAADSVDDFLFDSRRGFCGHYASALAALMRAAGIPARVVTGYHGGTYNRFADYWIVRQSDAHAWDEVWLGQGWLRVDPTSMIAPERVEHGLDDLVAAGQPTASRWQQRTPWLKDLRLRLDAMRLLWRERILRFDQGSQERLLEMMHIPEPDGQKVALVLAVCLILGMAWITWTVSRDQRTRPDAVRCAYDRLCMRLAALGFARHPYEDAEQFGARVAAARPDLAREVGTLCRRYSDLRYCRGQPREAAAQFIAAVRAFRPRAAFTPPDSRASS